MHRVPVDPKKVEPKQVDPGPASVDQQTMTVSPSTNSPGALAWQQALNALSLLLVDPQGLGGLVLKAQAGPVRDHLLSHLRSLIPADEPQVRLPFQTPIDRLMGGLDLAQTLSGGRPVLLPGALAQANAGWITIAMAERLPKISDAVICQCLDQGGFALARDGFDRHIESRFALIALDEGVDDEAVSASLRERLAFAPDLRPVARADMCEPDIEISEIMQARRQLHAVSFDEAVIDAIVKACAGFMITSMRAPWLTLRAARAAAALAGQDHIDEKALSLAASLVLTPRVRALPPSEDDADDQPPPPDPQDQTPDEQQDRSEQQRTDIPDELLVEAVKAVLPGDLLASLAEASRSRGAGEGDGKAGEFQLSWKRGRPIGHRRARPGDGKRLDLIATLTAAAPWQRIRRQGIDATTGVHGTKTAHAQKPQLKPRQVQVRSADLRFRQYQERRGTVMIFIVDASGSAALGRLAETKGAIELVLARCYVRRDEVAMIAFRGERAELLLPPTRSLARAKKSLVGMAGGGGTPLASGLQAGTMLARSVAAKAQTPSIILLTDGRANIAADGRADRPKAEQDAMAAARALAATGVMSILIDTATRSRPLARELASAMDARYVALPYADAKGLSTAVGGLIEA